MAKKKSAPKKSAPKKGAPKKGAPKKVTKRSALARSANSVDIIEKSGVLELDDPMRKFIKIHFTPQEAKAFVTVALKLKAVTAGPHEPKPCPKMPFACF